MRHYKVVRLLDLAKALAGNAEGLTLDEMAEVLKVDRRTAERMRDALRVVFPNLEEVVDGRTKRFRISGGLDSFMQAPTAEELAELEAAAVALDKGGAPARGASLRSLAAKIRSAQRPAVRRRVEPDLEVLRDTQFPASMPHVGSAVEAEILATLRDALLGTMRVIFDYTNSEGASRTRTVEPYGLLWAQPASYLVGPEEGKDEPVLWRLDRMEGVELGEYFAGIPGGFNLESYSKQSFGVFQEAVRTIRIRFDASVAALVKAHFFHETQRFDELGDGTIEVTFVAGGLLEIARHIMGWGGTAEAIEPAELRALIIDELDSLRTRHTGV